MFSKTGKHYSQTFRRGRLFWIFILALIIAIIIGFDQYVKRAYAGRIIPGIRISTMPVGGKTFPDAETDLAARIDAVLGREFQFHIENHTVGILPAVLAPDDPDLSRELISFNKNRALTQAMHTGRGPNPLGNAFEFLTAQLYGITVPLEATIDRETFQPALEKRLAPFLTPAKNAELHIIWENDHPRISVSREQSGTAVDLDAIWMPLAETIALLKTPELTLPVRPSLPTITQMDGKALIPLVEPALAEEKRTISFEKEVWEFSRKSFGSMLMLERVDGAVRIGIGGAGFDAFFQPIAVRIERPPRNAKFALLNGRVIEFQNSLSGIAFDRDATKRVLFDRFITKRESDAAIQIQKAEPEITTAEVNNLGIREMLGVGISNFRGSPPNRIKNIKNGAHLLNGILVKPEEEFSLLAALRPFTAENGYLPELVIKGDKIEPEVGGGLCQIGTTTFRATMNSGLPVTMRQNHSLVVTYYNDPSNGNPGTDATIYDPAPDFRFKNNTGAHILITTEVNTQSSELRFTFWGTSDGRSGSYGAPIVDRWIPTGPSRVILTTDLPPEKKKCQSRHPGADAHVTYAVTFADGSKNETVFTSHYRPLPEICLLGVEQLPEESSPEKSLSPTPELTPDEAADAM